MNDELKMVFKEIVYHIDDIGFQTEWLTKTLRKVDNRSRRTKFMLFSAIAAGIGYVVKNEKDKQKLEQELAKLKCKSEKDKQKLEQELAKLKCKSDTIEEEGSVF